MISIKIHEKVTKSFITSDGSSHPDIESATLHECLTHQHVFDMVKWIRERVYESSEMNVLNTMEARTGMAPILSALITAKKVIVEAAEAVYGGEKYDPLASLDKKEIMRSLLTQAWDKGNEAAYGDHFGHYREAWLNGVYCTLKSIGFNAPNFINTVNASMDEGIREAWHRGTEFKHVRMSEEYSIDDESNARSADIRDLMRILFPN